MLTRIAIVVDAGVRHVLYAPDHLAQVVQVGATVQDLAQATADRIWTTPGCQPGRRSPTSASPPLGPSLTTPSTSGKLFPTPVQEAIIGVWAALTRLVARLRQRTASGSAICVGLVRAAMEPSHGGGEDPRRLGIRQS